MTEPRPGFEAGPSCDDRPFALEIEDVAKRYGPQEALLGVSLTLERGERLALLGPNGAGKTTLVRCVSGRVRPDRGRIRLLGQPLTRHLRAENLGLVPQDIALYPALTARANLEVFGSFQGLRGAERTRRVDWALEWVGLSARASDRISDYSGGMKRRINLACGVLHRPRVLLLDEPTTGVDPQSRERIYDMLEELQNEGTAFVMTTHHLDEAEHRSDRLVILDRGCVVAQGTVSELVEGIVGSRRKVILRLDRPLDRDLPELAAEAQMSEVVIEVEEVAKELPLALERLQAAGHRIEDILVQAPNLHAAFIQLTGRELRE